MSDRKYYVICGENCFFESMTKEQILAAIEQAVSTGQIKDVDTGFVTKIKEQNKGVALTFWVGTQAEYNALTEKQNNCFYIITDDNKSESLEAAIEELKTSFSGLNEKVDKATERIIPKVLWEGEITTVGDTIKIDDIDKYNEFLIDILFTDESGYIHPITLLAYKGILQWKYRSFSQMQSGDLTLKQIYGEQITLDGMCGKEVDGEMQYWFEVGKYECSFAIKDTGCELECCEFYNIQTPKEYYTYPHTTQQTFGKVIKITGII